MAFCPHCGTPASDADTQCGKCGKSLAGAKKKARFAGTMMMDGVGAVSPGAQAQASPAADAPKGAEGSPKKLQETMLGSGGPTPAVASLRKPGSAGARPSVDVALADTAPRPGASSPGSRHLVGDPMAPEGAPRAAARRAQLPTTEGRRSPAANKSQTLLIVLLLGLVAIGGMGYAAAFVMGLL